MLSTHHGCFWSQLTHGEKTMEEKSGRKYGNIKFGLNIFLIFFYKIKIGLCLD